MGVVTKVLLLVLLLIAWIAFCVHQHLEEFVPKTNNQAVVEESVEVKPLTPVVEKEVLNKEEPKVVPASKVSTPLPKEQALKAKSEELKKEIKPVVQEKKALPKEVKKVAPKKVQLSKKEIQKQINDIVKEQRIIFKRLSTDVTKKSYLSINKIAELMKKHPTIKIEVGGHTDAKGEAKVNEWVSQERAKSVRSKLIKAGVKADRISAKGYGESKPLVKNDPQGYSTINRRVEFKVIGE